MPNYKQMRNKSLSERDQIANSLIFLEFYLSNASSLCAKLSAYHRSELNSNDDTLHELSKIKTEMQVITSRIETLQQMLS